MSLHDRIATIPLCGTVDSPCTFIQKEALFGRNAYGPCNIVCNETP